MTASTYVFDNAWTEERQRLGLLEEGWDTTTIERLEALGVAPGWRCLEVGAGGGSIASWLCERLGPTGSVVATDLDPRFLQALPHGNLEAFAHDIVTDYIEPGSFDLVHCRLLLEHLPQRDIALDRMIEALKPGGVLLAEEFDHLTFAPEPGSSPEVEAAWSAFARAFEALAAQRGLDLAYGRRLPGDLRRRGLVECGAIGRTQTQEGGSALSRVLALSALKMRDALVATGAVSPGQIERFAELLHVPKTHWCSQLMVSAWGRKT